MSVKRTLLVTLCLVILTSRAAADPYEDAAEAARQGDHVLMQQRYERILAANPNDVRALNGKATAQAWRGDYFAAIETYQKALSREPENIESLIGIGYAFSWAGDHAYAVDSFEKALDIVALRNVSLHGNDRPARRFDVGDRVAEATALLR